MNEISAPITAWSSRVWLTVLEVLPGVVLALIPGGPAKHPEVLGSTPPTS
jgi:hypothetical protein